MPMVPAEDDLDEMRGPVVAPFNFNAPDVARFSPEVTGRLLLKRMCRRLEWPSLAGCNVLDFGCGVRLACTLYNLEIDIGSYFGVDVNAEAIDWLKQNIRGQRFEFARIDLRNPIYNPLGSADASLAFLHGKVFDAACMFSVITHQAPTEAALIFRLLRAHARRLYFTALIDDLIADYVEKDAENPRLHSAYSTAFLAGLLSQAGWTIGGIYPPQPFQLTTFLCS